MDNTPPCVTNTKHSLPKCMLLYHLYLRQVQDFKAEDLSLKYAEGKNNNKRQVTPYYLKDSKAGNTGSPDFQKVPNGPEPP